MLGNTIPHPFINDLSELSMDEVQEKITDLTGKLTFAYRTSNQALIHQLNMALESYRSEYKKRMDKVFAKQKLDSQINIDKK